jgi:hypothetical protein
MVATLLIAAAALSVQPTKTTPLDMLKICSFNDALADDAFLHHWVEVTSKVSSIERDGIGGYIVHLDATLHTTQMIGRVKVCCVFSPASRVALAKIRPGADVTLRGVVREIDDQLDRMVDSNVKLWMFNCEVAAGAE